MSWIEHNEGNTEGSTFLVIMCQCNTCGPKEICYFVLDLQQLCNVHRTARDNLWRESSYSAGADAEGIMNPAGEFRF